MIGFLLTGGDSRIFASMGFASMAFANKVFSATVRSTAGVRSATGRALCALLMLLAVSAKASSEVRLASVYAAVADLQSGELEFAKHAAQPTAIASISKLMTAMVVLDSGQDMQERLTVRPRQQELGKTAWTRMRNASKATRADLLKIALMASENIACDVLARHYPGGLTAFVAAMNDKAQALGMDDSVFFDPAGLSPNNRASAADLVKLVRAAYDYPAIREATTTTWHQVRFSHPRYRLEYGNTNPLLHSNRWQVSLSKTGYLNEAGRCLVMVTEIDGAEKIVVVLDSLGTRSPLGDAGRLRRWLTSGDPGKVAAAARRYEQQRSAALPQATASLQ